MSAVEAAREEETGTKKKPFRPRDEAEWKFPTPEIVVAPPEHWGLQPNPAYLGVGPEIDLSGFRTSACLDTIKLSFRLKRSIAFNTVRAAIRHNPVITPDPREKRRASYFSLGWKHGKFMMTIQDVTAEKLLALQVVLDELGGIVEDAQIYEAHFALNWRSSSATARKRMAQLLPMVLNTGDLNLHGDGTPRQEPDEGVLNRHGTLHLRKCETVRYRKKEKRKVVSHRFYEYRRFLALSGSAYFGPKDDPVDLVRIYHKTVDDNRKPVEERKQVARHERVFRGRSLKELGMHTLSGLIGFDARRLARSFAYEIAAVPAQEGILQTVRLCKARRLMKAGAFAMRESEGGPTDRRPRGRKATIALTPMNKRSNNAWLAFAKKWEEVVRASSMS